MNRFFLGMTLGNDPHTVGIYKAGRIAKLGGIEFEVLSPDDTDEEKLRKIADLDPEFLGLSYRLSADKAVGELQKFLKKLEASGLLNRKGNAKRKLCFAGLLPTLKAVHSLGLDKKYNIKLMGSFENFRKTAENTISYFGFGATEAEQILQQLMSEANPPRIEILDQIAREVIKNDAYLLEAPLPIPSDEARNSFTQRMRESSMPLIRSHFGIPGDSIQPTIEGIMKIADARVIDEISLGSSDLSQRFFGDPKAFEGVKNDGGVPYKTKSDLIALKSATLRGNYPSIKPYCHVNGILEFVDTCLETGMLVGAHQAVPLFWFSELDGRGPMTVSEAIEEHKKAVAYLVEKGIPTEMNDPNQWSSRYAHDAMFVADYALVASVMYTAKSPDMIFQMQFNKPADTGDYADLAKMQAARELIEQVRPAGNKSRIYIETRSGIEHFSTNMEVAKLQLARSTLLQMLMNPSVIHLVSYCEADHAATPEDVIESSKILRRAVRLFKENEHDIRKAAQHPFVDSHRQHLKAEAQFLLDTIGGLGSNGAFYTRENAAQFLSDTTALQRAMQYRIMGAPGIAAAGYTCHEMMTHAGKFGEINCYRTWNDQVPMTEKERLGMLKHYMWE